jgi:DNA-binding NarL/FixJ family response regulator
VNFGWRTVKRRQVMPDTTGLTSKKTRAAKPGSGRLRILLVDDHILVRRALRALLESDPTFEIVGEAGTVGDALEAVERFQPHVALTAIGLPDRSGIDFAAELHSRRSATRVFVLTAHANREHIKAALTAGVLGYALGDASHAELVKGLRVVSTGQMFLSVCEPVYEPAEAPMLAWASEDSYSRVSGREREVLIWIARGYSNKETARALELSVKTVETHRRNIMHKLDLRGAAALTRFALDRGLVILPDMLERGRRRVVPSARNQSSRRS